MAALVPRSDDVIFLGISASSIKRAVWGPHRKCPLKSPEPLGMSLVLDVSLAMEGLLQ